MGKIIPTLYIVGFEVKRSDSAPIAKEMQKQIFTIVLDGGKKQDILNYVNKRKEELENGQYDYEMIALRKRPSKDIEDYIKTIPPHIQGMKYSEKYLGIKFMPHSKIKFFYVAEMPQPFPQTKVVSFENKEQLPPNITIDWKRQMPPLIDNQVQRILEALGMDNASTGLSSWRE